MNNYNAKIPKTVTFMLLRCELCQGTGKIDTMHGFAPCWGCESTGRKPVPFTELIK